ncbi:MAG: TetR/AcrR family transcriptional regulator [Proteobacteria bacterium]|nr:TetR/AcrR family transcriptional regulator [Pseudomonadota bacterium]
MAKRMTAEDRREQIARAAAALFARYGFSGVTTREIAKAAKVNEALLYRHFPTKEDLYTEIIRHKIAEQGDFIDDAMLSAGDDAAILSYIARTFVEVVGDDHTFIRLLLFSALEDHKLSTIFFDKRVGSVFPHLARYFERRTAEGAFRRMDPRIAVRAFVGMIMHYILTTEIFKMPEGMRVDREEAIMGFTNIFMEGVRAR